MEFKQITPPVLGVILLATISILSFELIQCDHLQQASDESSPDAGTPTNAHQNANPDYIKKELKEIMLVLMDKDKDKRVSYEELVRYLEKLHDKSIEYNVDKQWTVYSPQIHEVFSWEGYEPERKEVLTWDHYFNQTYPELIGVDVGIPMVREQDTARISATTDSSEKKITIVDMDTNEEEDPHIRSLRLMVHRADARWKLADENGDTLLTKDEFRHLLHPDEGNEALQDLFVSEATEDMDLDKDKRIDLDEFMKHIQLLATEQERVDQDWLTSQRENFGRFLDKNKDGVLDSKEIKDWLVPPKSKKFEAEAKRLLEVGDANKDHSLSTAEVLEHYEQYLSLLPPEYWQTPDVSELATSSILTNPDYDEDKRDEL